VNLKADGQGTNDWTALTGQIVALRSGTLTLAQPLSVGGLLVRNGATVTHAATATAASPQSVELVVGGAVYVGCGGAVDVSSRGYAAGVTYTGHRIGSSDGGSHLGEGGVIGPGYETFGSVVSPRENGSGSSSSGRGGGAVRVVAERVQVDGAIRANGERQFRGGAGGSVWIQTRELAGAGVIESKGGDATSSTSGGGGAIAVEYTSLEAGSTLLEHTYAQGGSTGTTGGAGTVFVRGGTAPTHGQLIVDNGTVGGHRRTILPSLGKGAAQSGSGGATLVTDRSKAIPAYFVGHWVEVRASESGPLKGTWRIAEIGVDGLTAVLSSNAGEPVAVEVGDSWQGVYRFDEYTVRGDVQVVSVDPIRVYSEQVITGTVETDAIHADRLVVKAGATLTQRLTSSASTPESLLIEVRELVVEAGGVIDVSSRGYAAGVTYPSHRVGSGDGGSHLGEGGLSGTGYETFGSVVSPRENGSGSSSSGRGGGAVRVIAERVQVASGNSAAVLVARSGFRRAYWPAPA
jgi:large repetitive protein